MVDGVIGGGDTEKRKRGFEDFHGVEKNDPQG